MNLIPCTDDCIYQQEGRCTLARAGSSGMPTKQAGCVHFLPRVSQRKDPLSGGFHGRQETE